MMIDGADDIATALQGSGLPQNLANALQECFGVDPLCCALCMYVHVLPAMQSTLLESPLSHVDVLSHEHSIPQAFVLYPLVLPIVELGYRGAQDDHEENTVRPNPQTRNH